MIEVPCSLAGAGQPCFVIAEAGVNHNGDVGRALELVAAAAAAGANAVKFQTFSAARLVSAAAPKAAYQETRTPAEQSQLEMLAALELSRDDHERLFAECQRQGIVFLSSPFDEASADLLADLGVEAFKVPSGELTNRPYLRHVASYGRCLIVSTGMADQEEVDTAVATIRESGDPPFVLLHCVSLYPAPPAGTNLRAIVTMRERYGVPVGFSDHSIGSAIPLAAVALGASVLEKHLTLDRSLPGPDHAASMEPAELARLVRDLRDVESALGDGVKKPLAAELETAAAARKSLVAATFIAAGAVVTREMLTLKRPGTGIPPDRIGEVVGRRAAVDIPADSLIDWRML